MEDIKLDDFTLTVTIGEPADTRTVLSELSTALPEAATGVDVRVKRTINANEWSTICLPFSMTAEQVTAAFGSGVQIGDITGGDVDEETNGITANFASVTAIEKNHPEHTLWLRKVVTVVLCAFSCSTIPKDWSGGYGRGS